MSLNTSPSFDMAFSYDEPFDFDISYDLEYYPPYESAWECYGGLTPDEEWEELYAELNS